MRDREPNFTARRCTESRFLDYVDYGDDVEMLLEHPSLEILAQKKVLKSTISKMRTLREYSLGGNRPELEYPPSVLAYLETAEGKALLELWAMKTGEFYDALVDIGPDLDSEFEFFTSEQYDVLIEKTRGAIDLLEDKVTENVFGPRAL